MFELIVGAFGSGKTTLLLHHCLKADNALLITYTKTLKYNALRLLQKIVPEPPTTVRVQTLDSFIAAHGLSACAGNDFKGKREAFVAMDTWATWPSKPLLLGIDDADIFHPSVIAQLLRMASHYQIACVITSRQLLPQHVFLKQQVLSTCVRCPLAHQQLMQVLFHKGQASKQASRMESGPFLIPYKNTADIADEILPYLQPETIILCNNIDILRALELFLMSTTSWSVGRYDHNATAVFENEIVLCSVSAFYGLESRRVILFADKLSLSLLVEGLTRATTFLAVVFASQHPPPLFLPVYQQLLPYVVPTMTWINWEAKKIGPVTPPLATTVKTVSDLVQELLTLFQDVQESQCLLEQVAQHLKWLVTPRIEMCRVYQRPLFFSSIVSAHHLTAVAGRVSELIMCRELYFIEPKAIFIWPPATAQAYTTALACDDTDFLQCWQQHRSLIWKQGTTEDWTVEFRRPKWGNNRVLLTQMAEALALQPVPHYILPATLKTPEMQQQIRQALADYSNIETEVLSEQTWWILGALEHFFNSLQHRQQHATTMDTFPLVVVCRRWSLMATDEFFTFIAKRLRHFLITLHAQHLEEQVPVKTATLMGSADFIINENCIVELKTSTKSWDNAWALQAAIYAYEMKLPEAHVFNVLNGGHTKIVFDENLFY